MEKLLSPRETADLLGVKTCTVYTWAYRRQIPSQKVGKLLKFSPSALQRWLKDQERKSL
jgi:excisionase family DNA binding protein